MVTRRRPRVAPLALAVLLAVGCHDADGPGLAAGTFDAQLSGGVTESFAGSATHGESDYWGELHLGLVAEPRGDSTGMETEILLDHYHGQPGTGRYPIVAWSSTASSPDAGTFVVAILKRHGARMDQLYLDPAATQGTLRLTTATSLDIAGTFTVEGPARWSDSSSAGIVRVEGRFRSRPYDTAPR